MICSHATPCTLGPRHHHGAGDSVYQQWVYQAKFYRALRDKGIYIHAPDDFFFAGINKNCMACPAQTKRVLVLAAHS